MACKHSKTYLFIYNFNILKEESLNYKIFVVFTEVRGDCSV